MSKQDERAFERDEIRMSASMDLEDAVDLGRDMKEAAAKLRAGVIAPNDAAAVLERGFEALAAASRRGGRAYDEPADGKSIFIAAETLPYTRSALIEAATEEEARALYMSLWDEREGGVVYELQPAYQHDAPAAQGGHGEIEIVRVGTHWPLPILYATDLPLPPGVDRVYGAAALNREERD